jgi:hypothetical protein
MGEHRTARFWWRNLKERDHYEDLDVQSTIILRCNSKKQDSRMSHGLIWLRTGTWYGILELYKMQQIS